MTYEQIRSNPAVRAYIKMGNDKLGVLGYTDHSEAHCALVAERAGEILRRFGHSEEEIEIVKIAGFLHDIGNAINRSHHAEYGALLANQLLMQTDLSTQDCVEIVSCIGNHDESTGGAFDAISAALIIADKTDVRRNRVRTRELSAFDKHDRVNYAVTKAELVLLPEEKKICLQLQLDESICTMFEYFEIFLGRMLMCRKAAEMLGAQFRLTANGGKII